MIKFRFDLRLPLIVNVLMIGERGVAQFLNFSEKLFVLLI